VFWDAVDVPGVLVDDVEGAGGVADDPDVSEALLAFLGCLPCPERLALALALVFACVMTWFDKIVTGRNNKTIGLDSMIRLQESRCSREFRGTRSSGGSQVDSS
jgi:hypothetical protein